MFTSGLVPGVDGLAELAAVLDHHELPCGCVRSPDATPAAVELPHAPLARREMAEPPAHQLQEPRPLREPLEERLRQGLLECAMNGEVVRAAQGARVEGTL